MGIEIISSLRQYKTQKNLSLKEELKRVVIDCDEETKKKIKMIEDDIKWTMNVKEIDFGKVENGIGGNSLKIEVKE